MIGMVEAIHVSFQWRSQSSPLCWKQLHFGTVQFRDENRPHHQDFWRTFAHEFGWHEVFLFVKRCQRRSLWSLHSVVFWYTPSTRTLAGCLFRNLGWHVGFVSSVLIVLLSSRSSCVRVVWSFEEHHTTVRESRSPRSLESYGGRSPVSFSAEKALVFISAFFASVWSRDGHLCILEFLREVRSSKRLRWHCEIFCLQRGSSDYHRFDCAVWFRDEHHSTRIWGGSLHTSLVDMKFLRLRRGASDDHCDICTEILVDMIALFHRSWLCSSAVVLLVFALCGLLENFTPPWWSRPLQEAWNHMKVVLQFPSLRKNASDHQCFLCVVWSRDEHFALFREWFTPCNWKVFLFVTGSQTQSFPFFFSRCFWLF